MSSGQFTKRCAVLKFTVRGHVCRGPHWTNHIPRPNSPISIIRQRCQKLSRRIMKKQRRRGTRSDWVLALQQSRRARDLRRTLTPIVTKPKKLRSEISSNSGRNDVQPALMDRTPFRSECPNEIEQETQPVHPEGRNIVQEEGEDTETRSIQAVPLPSALKDLSQEDEGSITENDITNDVCASPTQDYFQPFENSAHPGRVNEGGSDEDEGIPGMPLNDIEPFSPCSGQGEASADDRDRNADFELLRRNYGMWVNRLNLAAVVSIVGSVRYTVDQYDYTRHLLQDQVHGNEDIWPAYSRSRRYFQTILSSCLPESRLVSLRRKDQPSSNELPALEGTGIEREDRQEHSDMEQVRIFFPSAWAKLDVATSSVFDLMYNSTPDRQGGDAGLGRSPMVQERDSVLDCCNHMFIQQEGKSVACSSGSFIKVSAQRSKPSFNTQFSFSGAHGEYHFTAAIIASWCVGAVSCTNPSFEKAIRVPSLTNYQKRLMKSLSTAPYRAEVPDDPFLGVLPGDTCTLLSHERDIRENEYSPVLVHRFWRYEEGIPSTFVLWARPYQSNSTGSDGSVLTRKVAAAHTVSISCLSRRDNNERPCPPAKIRGSLADGTSYVVYRLLLYCDDFQKSSQAYPKGSAGGCYFLPLSLPPKARRKTSSVRIVSLTPPGVSTNDVLHYITDDLVQTTVHGVDGFTPTGERIRIFLDVLGFVGDYPASSGVVDLIGHVGRAPCTLCSFRRLHDSEAEGSKFGYTTSVHAANSTFQRHAERHISLRRCGIPDDDANVLGMVQRSKYSQRNCPLLHFYEKLQSERQRIPLTDHGRKVVSGLFDPYRSNVVAPDHLLTGLSKDILNTLFECLPSQQLRTEVDISICAALRDNGLLPQKEVFNMKRKMLHSMTLSELYCVILVAVPTVRVLTSNCPSSHIVKDAVMLLTELQRLIALTYWWPQRDIDGEEAVCFVHKRRNLYISELKQMAKHYVQAVDRFCCRASGVKVHIDKPNLHRLIELYEHTIPAFGHVREFMELVFESTHQPLKRCIARSNNHKSHIFAVEHCIGNDWQGRIAALSRDLSHDDEMKRIAARRGLRHLLLGTEADQLDEERDRDFIRMVDSVLANLFTPTLQRQFGRDGMISNFTVSKHSVWKARGVCTITDLSRTLEIQKKILKEVVQTATRWINAVYPPVDNDQNCQSECRMKIFKFAKRVKLSDSGRQVGKTNGFDVVSSNCVLHAHTTDDRRNDKVLISHVVPGSRPVFSL